MAEDITVLIANLGRTENLLPCLSSLDNAAGETSFGVIVGFNFHGESDAGGARARISQGRAIKGFDKARILPCLQPIDGEKHRALRFATG